jgi:hypothetical protein
VTCGANRCQAVPKGARRCQKVRWYQKEPDGKKILREPVGQGALRLVDTGHSWEKRPSETQ